MLGCALSGAAHANECFTPLAWQPELQDTPLDADDNFIDDRLDEMPVGATSPVIVLLNRCGEPEDLDRLSDFGQIRLISKYVSLAILDDVSHADLTRLAADPIVAFIEQDGKGLLSLDVSNPAVRVRPSPDYSPDTVDEQYPAFDGTGINIAIVDSGVDDGGTGASGTVHDGLPGAKFVGGADCTSGTCVLGNPDDQHGHGTHVAGIALGTGAGSENVGIAPGAGLVDLQVANPDGSVPSSAVLAALELLLDRDDWDVRVANLSFQSGDSTGTDSWSVMVNRLVFEGIAVITAAGNCSNAGLALGCVLTPSPGAARDAVSTANQDDRGTIQRADDTINPDSMQGRTMQRKPDISAPGSNILSADSDTLSGYVPMSGTSMSAPHIAGCVARLIQAAPSIRPLSIRQLLLDTAEDFGPADWDIAWGQGSADCFAAMDQLMTTPGTDLRFEVYLGRAGEPTWWRSPNVYPVDPTVEEGEPNQIRAEVWNDGPNPVSDYSVRIGVYNFSNSDADYFVCEVSPGLLAPGGRTTVTCPYRPRVSGSPPGTVHACMKAEIVYSLDTDFGNNRAQHNVNIRQTASPARFRMEVVNPTDSVVTTVLTPTPKCGEGPSNCCDARTTPGCTDAACQAEICAQDPFCCTDQWDSFCVDSANSSNICVPGCLRDFSCPGWEANLSQTNLTLLPDDCPVPIEIELEPFDPTERTARFDIPVILEVQGSNCCEPGNQTGCSDHICEAIVCTRRPECCGGPWTDECASIAVTEPRCELGCADRVLDTGGVTAIAELGCQITDLTPSVGAGGEVLWFWDAASYSICPTVWDFVRGELPIIDGDFSSAQCIANDLIKQEFLDQEIPDPGSGFYYLARAGGDEPGTFNNGTQAADRDSALVQACP
ncbi:hypothetical protein ABI59_09310 [Acidobacteria bacterium Mor1]|nr:hypothetical protein ABI59_09310 [Acidobacteria bacterium Mor1]